MFELMMPALVLQGFDSLCLGRSRACSASTDFSHLMARSLFSEGGGEGGVLVSTTP